jgi:chromosome segregation ATPase
MLRAQVADLAYLALVKGGCVPSAKGIRQRLGGGDIERIQVHLSEWFRRTSHIFRQAADDQYLNLERDELSEALHQIREVKKAAATFAASMYRVFSEDLAELREHVAIVKAEATQLGRMMTEILSDRPEFEKALENLRTEATALKELIEQTARTKATEMPSVPPTSEITVKEAIEDRKSLQQIDLYLREERARLEAEWEETKNLKALLQKNQKAVKSLVRSQLAELQRAGRVK